MMSKNNLMGLDKISYFFKDLGIKYYFISLKTINFPYNAFCVFLESNDVSLLSI